MYLVKRWFVSALCMLTCLLPLLACENQRETGDPKVLLGTLAEQYWTKRLVDFDYKSTYKMELEKDSIPFSEYLKKVKNAGQIKVLSIKTKKVKIENDKGFVELTAKCRMAPVPKDLELPLTDLWIYKSNQWKHKLPKAD